MLKTKINRLLLITFASAICLGIIIFSFVFSKRLKEEENKNMTRWAMATSLLATSNSIDGDVMKLLLQTVQDNTTIPVIVTDSEGRIILDRNLSIGDDVIPKEEKNEILAQMRTEGHMIEIPLETGEKQLLYYSDSHLLKQLSYMPIISLGMVLFFVIFAYMVISKANKSEQDKVWIGLARESAHQLGTPITALEGWKELLEDTDIDRNEVAKGIGEDIRRLSNIAERFSKIGSNTEFDSNDIAATISHIVDYLRRRASHNIDISFVNDFEGRKVNTPHNTVLIGWVIENLCRNSIDAMEGRGQLTVRLLEDSGRLAIDITDTGKGMNKKMSRQIFKAGFTTKQRGWGIGLSLSKRIIEQYHKGKIFVRSTDIGKGTVMRVVLCQIQHI